MWFQIKFQTIEKKTSKTLQRKILKKKEKGYQELEFKIQIFQEIDFSLLKCSTHVVSDLNL